jgi:hypothetical protein
MSTRHIIGIKIPLHISLLVLFTSTTTLHAQLDQSDMAANLTEALTFTKYPTYAQYDSMMHHFADSYPAICRIDTFGTSIQGRLLLALKISDNPNTDEDEPAFLYTSTMHGDELVGYVLTLRLIDFILSNYGSNPEIDRIVDELEIWINPLANPDGAYYFNRDTTVRYSRRENINGIDLNRNFPKVPDTEPNNLKGTQSDKPQGNLKSNHQNELQGTNPDNLKGTHLYELEGTYPDDPKGTQSDKPQGTPQGNLKSNHQNELQGTNPDNLKGTHQNELQGTNPDEHKSSYPDDLQGPHPEDLSGVEPENIHMIRFMQQHRFNLSANMHSGAEVVNYPWDYTYALHPDDDWYRFISREYADGVHDVEPTYMLGFDNGITNGAVWYIIEGGRQDYVNYFMQGREVTLELSDIKKLPSELLDAHWSYNQWSLINYISQARYGIHGKVTCRRTGVPAPAEIRILNHDDDHSWVRSDTVFGSFYRYLKEGVYDLAVSAEGFVPDTVRGVAVFDYQRTDLLVALDSLVTGDRNVALQQALVCFPNPAREVLYLGSEQPFEAGARLEVYATTGTRVHSELLSAGSLRHRIDVAVMHPGVYLLRIRSGTAVYNLRFVKL